MKRTHRIPRIVKLAVVFMLLLAVTGGYALLQPSPAPAYAGAEIVGNPNGAVGRYLITQGTTVKRIVYVAAGVHTPVSGTTPESGQPSCGNAGDLHMLEFDMVGTMTGTAPTLNVAWQNSVDGVNWYTIATTVPINLTAVTTPANLSQKLTVADVKNDTSSKAYGDCWRTQITYGGTGSISGSYTISGLEK